MRIARSSLLVAATLLGLAWAPRVSAHTSYVSLIPNGAQSDCRTCHNGDSGGPLNPFGSQFNGAGRNASSWGAIFDDDADGDSQTNGEELGDPCGLFTSGGTPARTTQISHPANPSSTSTTPSAPDADDDEVSDSCDNCPDDTNTDQADADDDGTGDVCQGGTEGEGEPAEGEGEGEEGEGEGEEGEGEGGSEGEGEGEEGPCTSSSVSSNGPGSGALASLALLALVGLRRKAPRSR